MVIDDDLSIRKVIHQVLSLEGYLVQEAGNGAEALEVLLNSLNNPPGLLLLDMQMPVMDGWKFLPAYRHQFSEYLQAPVVVMTASLTVARYANQIKANGYLAKPFNIEELIGIVKSYLNPPGER